MSWSQSSDDSSLTPVLVIGGIIFLFAFTVLSNHLNRAHRLQEEQGAKAAAEAAEAAKPRRPTDEEQLLAAARSEEEKQLLLRAYSYEKYSVVNGDPDPVGAAIRRVREREQNPVMTEIYRDTINRYTKSRNPSVR
jgi:hypothetical protein